MPAIDVIVSVAIATTVNKSTRCDTSTVTSIGARTLTPQTKLNRIVTAVVAIVTRPNPSGDMYSCSSVPNCDSRVILLVVP